MPSLTTKGTAVSFTNTPQAGDDVFNLSEDAAMALGIGGNTIALNVMANDLGGNAKKLYSIDDGNGNPLSPEMDLLVKDAIANGTSPWETTDGGNEIRIANGQIELRLSNSLTELGATDINSMAAGDVIDDYFVYSIQLGNGTISQAFVRIHIEGVNDVAVITGDTTGQVVEDDDLVATGALVVSDDDHDEDGTQVATNVATSKGTFSVDGAGNWTYNVNNDAIQHLGAGVHDSDSFVVKAIDGTEQMVTIDIVGKNDEATFGGDLTGSVTEDGTLTKAGTLTVTDVDDNESGFKASETGIYQGTYGEIDWNAATGGYTYTLHNSDSVVQLLNSDDVRTDSFTFHSLDGTAVQLDITVNGANEPVVVNIPDENDFDGVTGSHTATQGDDNPLVGTAGDDGTLAAPFSGLQGNDTIYGGAGDDFIAGNNGNDKIYAGSGNDRVEGNNDPDQLFGGSGNDILLANNGNDLLVGGRGADILTGGGDADTFRFDKIADSTVASFDTITDFNAAQGDKIDITLLGAAIATFTTDGTNGVLHIDVAGNGVGEDMQIALTGVNTFSDGSLIHV